MRILRSTFRRCVHSPLFWLSLLYILLGGVYAWVTPALEKTDEQGHYGYILYLREHRALPPFFSEPASVLFRQADLAFTRHNLEFEFHQPPLYYAVVAILTAWLPDDPDPDLLLTVNPYLSLSVPAYRNDNRNYFLHPPDMTPLVLGARLVSLLFGLGTMLTSYSIAVQLFPRNSSAPIAVAAITGFQPNFILVATALGNDIAIAFFGALTIALLVYRLQKGNWAFFAPLLGLTLGLASITKVSGLVFFPLVGLALLLIQRGFRRALFRDAFVIAIVALLVGGWWYARNMALYGNPLSTYASASQPPSTSVPQPASLVSSAGWSVIWNRLRRDLSTVEYTFWAQQARAFTSPILLDHVLIWWGRISLGLLVLSCVLCRRSMQANLQIVLLLSWPVAFLLFLILYWNNMFYTPHGRFLFPAFAAISAVIALAWHRVFLLCWPRLASWVLVLNAGMLIVIGSLIPFVTLYPLYHPSREWQVSPVQHPIGIVYADSKTGGPVAKLIGYNLPQPFALAGSYFPIELCWEPLGQTSAPYAVFIQLLDLSPLKAQRSPAAWGRRETFPGLGNRPTDRWAIHKAFCDMVFVRVFPETPTPLGAAIEVGFTDPNQQDRLQALDQQGDAIALAVIGWVPVLSRGDLPAARQPARYILDNAIGLDRVQLVRDIESSITLTLTWQSLQTVPYDATMFIHLKGTGTGVVAQIDRQPLDGRCPTSVWLPGQIVTDVIHLPLGEYDGPLTLNMGMYMWPSLERLPVKDASGILQQDNVIVVDIPPDLVK